MPDCMKNLRTTGMEEAVRDAIRNKPFFAVCVGEQMLFEHSEEGDTPGWAFSRATSFALLPTVWIKLAHASSSSDGLEPGDADPRTSHVERYHQRCLVLFCSQLLRQTDRSRLDRRNEFYGEEVTVAVARDNVFATQFHPEKSAAAGLALYQKLF